MDSYPVPANEAARLEALRSYGILDTDPEPEFDALARLAAQVCDAPIALVTLVDDRRQWYKSRVGTELREVPRTYDGFCANAILGREVLHIPDASEDQRFAQSPVVTRLGIRFYCGVPLVNREEMSLGTLCVLDYRERTLRPEQIEALRTISHQVMAQLELRRLAALGEFREKLISILRHDLRSPLQQIVGAAREELALSGLGPEHRNALAQISVTAERMIRTIRDTLDFTQTRLGHGLPMQPRLCNLHAICRKAISEFAFAYPGREIQLEVQGEGTGVWDEERLEQAVTNLLANAVRYGHPRPIRVVSSTDDEIATLSVHNDGELIEPELADRLFAPICRTPPGQTSECTGLGLGLFIVKEIATASGGTVEAISNQDTGTVFRMRLPRQLTLQNESLRSLLRH